MVCCETVQDSTKEHGVSDTGDSSLKKPSPQIITEVEKEIENSIAKEKVSFELDIKPTLPLSQSYQGIEPHGESFAKQSHGYGMWLLPGGSYGCA